MSQADGVLAKAQQLTSAQESDLAGIQQTAQTLLAQQPYAWAPSWGAGR